MKLPRKRLLALAMLRLCTVSSALAAEPTRSPDGIERVAIGAYIRAHLQPIDECYGQRLNSQPHLRGKMIIRFDVESEGVVSDISADGMSDPGLVDCVLGQIQGWRFEKPSGGARLHVAYPLTFQPG